MTARPLRCGLDSVLGQVLAAHGRMCACTGECGSRHKDGLNGRCVAPDRAEEPLAAAPCDLSLSDHEAARLPAARLRPLCPACLRKARTAVRRAKERANAEELAAAQQGLFTL